MVPYANLGGGDGMRITRAAFSVMVKFSDMFDDLSSVLDEIDMISSTTEPAQLDQALKDQLRNHPNWEHLFKRWESASKMRSWISEKKKNLAERIKKEVEADFSKKKKEQKEKEEKEEKNLRKLIYVDTDFYYKKKKHA